MSLEGYSIRIIDPNKILVLPKGYILTRGSGSWRCDCPARKACKHLELVPEDMKVRRFPRAVLDDAGSKLSKCFFNPRYSACGSYRRLAPDSKDLDIIIDCTPVEFAAVCECVESLPEWTTTKHGPKQLHGFLGELPVDIDRVCDPAEWAAHLLYRTGPAGYNIALRALAKQQGWTLSERTRAASEAEILERLGVEWLPPEERK